jgi:MFS family permease
VSRLRAEHLLPLACAGGCAMLAASEFMDTFNLNSAGPTPQVVQTAADQHHYALLVLAGFALVALVFAVLAGSKPAAAAVAICGAGALLIFLLIDLPDAGKVGAISDVNLTEAKAEPATGFWLELAGALVLAICGGALATLSPDQLRAFARSVDRGRPPAKWKPSTRASANPGPEKRAEESEGENEQAAKTESG